MQFSRSDYKNYPSETAGEQLIRSSCPLFQEILLIFFFTFNTSALPQIGLLIASMQRTSSLGGSYEGVSLALTTNTTKYG